MRRTAIASRRHSPRAFSKASWSGSISPLSTNKEHASMRMVATGRREASVMDGSAADAHVGSMAATNALQPLSDGHVYTLRICPLDFAVVQNWHNNISRRGVLFSQRYRQILGAVESQECDAILRIHSAKAVVASTRSENITVSWRSSAASPAELSAVAAISAGAALGCDPAPRGRDGIEQLATMPIDGDPQILHVLRGQAPQDRVIDLILPECCLICPRPRLRSQAAQSVTAPWFSAPWPSEAALPERHNVRA